MSEETKDQKDQNQEQANDSNNDKGFWQRTKDHFYDCKWRYAVGTTVVIGAAVAAWYFLGLKVSTPENN